MYKTNITMTTVLIKCKNDQFLIYMYIVLGVTNNYM